MKFFEKMVKEIHLFIKIFEKLAKEIHLFSKNKKIVKKKGLKKRWSLQKSQKSLKKWGMLKKWVKKMRMECMVKYADNIHYCTKNQGRQKIQPEDLPRTLKISFQENSVMKFYFYTFLIAKQNAIGPL